MKKKVIFSIIFFMLVAICINIPSFATFKITDFVIDSQLNKDGSLHVTERISYYTDEYVNGLTRKIVTKNPRNTTNSADSLQLNYVKRDGEYCKQVNSATEGDDGIYEYTQSNNEYNIKLYSPFIGCYKTIEYDYTLENVAVKYNDIGELFWNYIGNEWDCLIQNLTINITLPQSAANETIYVFGHGSDDGTFTKNENYITLKAKNLSSYQPLDARILFSRDTISSSKKIVNKNVLDKYINEEEGLSSKMDNIKVFANLDINELAIILSLIIIGAGIVCYFVYDKEIKVEKIKYYREMPYGLEPELLQYIYYGKIKSNSYYIAVLNLVKLGVYKIENTVNKVGKETQKIVYNPEHNARLKEYQEDMVKTINGFLEDNENGEKSLDLIKLASKMERTTSRGFSRYQSSLATEKEGLVGKPTKIPGNIKTFAFIAMFGLIAIIAMCSIKLGNIEMVNMIVGMLGMVTLVYSIFFASVGGIIPVLIFVLCHCSVFQIAILGMMMSSGVGILYIPYILLFILIQYLLRVKKFSEEERQIVEYVSGLRRYIKDYSMLKDKESLDYIELWEDYFIMAIALDLNNKTVNYFYNYGKEQNSNLGYSMHSTNSYMNFHYGMYNSFYNYQRAYTTTTRSSSSGSSFSGSSGGFSGGSSSGGGGGRRWRRRTLLKMYYNKI